jgi:hypothetical protein
MSLINDALKRASQSQKRQPREAQVGAPMQPVSADAAPPGKSRVLLFAVSAAVIVIGLGVFFLWQWWQTQNRVLEEIGQPKQSLIRTLMGGKHKPAPDGQSKAEYVVGSTAPVEVKTAPAETSNSAAAGVAPVAPAEPGPTPDVVIIPTNTSGASTSAPVSTQPKPPAPPTPAVPRNEVVISTPPPPPAVPAGFPTVRVTTVFYRAKNPQAVVNGRTVREGEEIDGVKIVKIEPRKVTLGWQGHTKEVYMGP